MENYKSALLIDSNEIDNFINKKLLEESGVRHIQSFNNAITALIHLRNETIRYVYIFVSIYLPVMDGFEFIAAFNNSSLDKIHGSICILSSTINPDHKAEATIKNVLLLEKPLSIEAIKQLTIK